MGQYGLQRLLLHLVHLVFVAGFIWCMLEPSASLAAGTPSATGATSVAAQLTAALNKTRSSAGAPPLVADPLLTSIAAARAQYIVDQGLFTHCTGNEVTDACPNSGFVLTQRLTGAGLNVKAPGFIFTEDLALNNYPAASLASQTLQGWLQDPGRRADLLNPAFHTIGFATVCCFTGAANGQFVSGAMQANIVVGVLTTSPSPVATPDCSYVLGFLALEQQLVQVVGTCRTNEQHNPANGDAIQMTSAGMLVWRKADNWTAFTDGYRTWVNGPNGLAERLNSQRFTWEANPDHLPVVQGSVVQAATIVRG